MRARSASVFNSPRLPLILFLIFLVICGLGGGASRAEVLSQTPVRVAAILFVSTCLLLPKPGAWTRLRLPFVFIGLLAALMLAQLMPLPPEMWADLPGRKFYTEAAAAAGMDQPWRPLSLSPDLTLNSLLALLPAVAGLVAVAYVRLGDRGLLLGALVVVVLTSAVFGILQVATGKLVLYRIWSEGTPVGLFANRNHQAAFLAVGIPLLLAWSRRPESDEKGREIFKWAALGGGLLLLPLILMTGSRTGLALSGLAFLLSWCFSRFGWKQPHSKSHNWRGKLISALPTLAAVLIASATLLLSKAASVQRFVNFGAEDDLRLTMISTLREMLLTFNVAGIGFGAFDPVFRRFEPVEYLDPSYFNHAHNDFIEVLLEGGLGGLLLIAAFTTWWVLRTWRIWREKSSRSEVFYARIGSIVTLLLIIASASDYPLRTPIIMTFFAICCGWMQDQRRTRTN